MPLALRDIDRLEVRQGRRRAQVEGSAPLKNQGVRAAAAVQSRASRQVRHSDPHRVIAAAANQAVYTRRQRHIRRLVQLDPEPGVASVQHSNPAARDLQRVAAALDPQGRNPSQPRRHPKGLTRGLEQDTGKTRVIGVQSRRSGSRDVHRQWPAAAC